MATPQQIAEQVALEREQIRQGLKRLRKNTRDLEQKEYASATIYGIASIDTLMPLVVERIENTKTRLKERKNGVAFKEIQKYLIDLESIAAAAISLKLTFDKVFGCKQNSNALVKVTEAIGQAVENECKMRHYEANAPGLLNVLKDNYWHKHKGTQQKVTVIQTLMNRYGIEPWKTWGSANRVKLGAWLLDCVMKTSGWFYKEQRLQGRKRVNYIMPTPEFYEIKDQVMANAELFSPIAWPMYIEPNDWTNEMPGGYLLNEVMRGHDLVRRGNPSSIQGETPIAFLNRIQKVGYKVNTFILDVADWMDEKRIAVGKFIPIIEANLPPKPIDIETNEEARQAYRRATAEAMDINSGAFDRNCRTRKTMEAAKQFKDKVFYHPWSLDYRGRAYPIPAYLTPQDTDFGKSLLKFERPSLVTPEAEKWLAFQVATTFGLDKSPMEERQLWVKHNIPLITLIACDPCGNISEWESVEEPWQFLAACDEYYHCVIKKDRDKTNLPIAIDATCSGLQILAGLARDRRTAELVNVTRSDKPQDAYKVIAMRSRGQIPLKIRSKWDRKKVKRTVMTIPYNAKPYSNRTYIQDALKEDGIEIETVAPLDAEGVPIRDSELTQTVKAVRDAMHKEFPGPMAVMKWIEDEVSRALARGITELEWTTPSGFVVNQKLMKKDIQRLTLQLLGECRLHVATGDTNEADKARTKAATAPNLIHSLDASLLHIATIRFKNPIAVIHDSVLCRATDMTILSTLVKETYMLLFAKHDYLRDFAKQIGAESEPPIIGDLEPSNVLNSTYFFC
jgi:DNA-directed RNA polymerase